MNIVYFCNKTSINIFFYYNIKIIIYKYVIMRIFNIILHRKIQFIFGYNIIPGKSVYDLHILNLRNISLLIIIHEKTSKIFNIFLISVK